MTKEGNLLPHHPQELSIFAMQGHCIANEAGETVHRVMVTMSERGGGGYGLAGMQGMAGRQAQGQKAGHECRGKRVLAHIALAESRAAIPITCVHTPSPSMECFWPLHGSAPLAPRECTWPLLPLSCTPLHDTPTCRPGAAAARAAAPSTLPHVREYDSLSCRREVARWCKGRKQEAREDMYVRTGEAAGRETQGGRGGCALG